MSGKTLTREEWSKIRKGSILRSPSGALRKVISSKSRDSEYVTFFKLNESGIRNNPTTTYVYNDLCRGYILVKT